MITGFSSSFLAHGLFFVALVAGEWSCRAFADRALFKKPRPAREVRKLDACLRRAQLTMIEGACVCTPPPMLTPRENPPSLFWGNTYALSPDLSPSTPHPLIAPPPASFQPAFDTAPGARASPRTTTVDPVRVHTVPLGVPGGVRQCRLHLGFFPRRDVRCVWVLLSQRGTQQSCPQLRRTHCEPRHVFCRGSCPDDP